MLRVPVHNPFGMKRVNSSDKLFHQNAHSLWRGGRASVKKSAREGKEREREKEIHEQIYDNQQTQKLQNKSYVLKSIGIRSITKISSFLCFFPPQKNLKEKNELKKNPSRISALYRIVKSYDVFMLQFP